MDRFLFLLLLVSFALNQKIPTLAQAGNFNSMKLHFSEPILTPQHIRTPMTVRTQPVKKARSAKIQHRKKTNNASGKAIVHSAKPHEVSHNSPKDLGSPLVKSYKRNQSSEPDFQPRLGDFGRPSTIRKRTAE